MQEQREFNGRAPPLRAHSTRQLPQPHQPLPHGLALNRSAEKYQRKSFSSTDLSVSFC